MAKKYIFRYSIVASDGSTIQEKFTFNLPQKSAGNQAPETEILKLYLGIDSVPGESSGEYDERLYNRVRIWQNDHYEEIASFYPEGTLNNLLPTVGEVFEAPGAMKTGEVGEFTYKAMMSRGLAAAAKMYLESPYWLNVKVQEDLDISGGMPTQNDEAQRDPTMPSPDWVEYKYVTEYTSVRVQEGQTLAQRPDLLGPAVRKAVLDVFKFYGKPTTWVVSGEPQPELLENSSIYKSANDLVLLYDSFLKRRDRVAPDETFGPGREFTITVDDPGSLYEQVNGAKVDALYKMSLSPGGTVTQRFCVIKEISPPSLRPTGTYNVTIAINRRMFEGIVGGNITSGRIGGTFDVTDPENWKKAEKLYEDTERKVKNLYRQAGNAIGDLTDASKMHDQVDKFVKGQERKAKAAAKNLAKDAWQQAKTGTGGLTEAERQEKMLEALKEASGRSARTITLEIEVKQLYILVERLAKKLEEYHADLEVFRKDNAGKPSSRFDKPIQPIIPEIDPKEEARKIKEIIPALLEVFDANGYRKNFGANSEDILVITFDPIDRMLFVPTGQDSSLEPNLDNVAPNPTAKGTMQTVGYQIALLELTNADNDFITDFPVAKQKYKPEAGTNRAVRPFIYPTTMGYLSQMGTNEDDDPGDLEKSLLDNPCDDLLEENAAVVFFSKFHWPVTSFTPKKRKPSNLVSFDASVTLGSENSETGVTKIRTVKNISSFREAAILTAREEIEEQKALLDKNLKAFKESTLFEKRGKIINTGDVYPDFEKIPCDIEKMWEQFLNQWDMDLIMCDLQKCIPQLPRFNFNFNWKLPKLPSIPTFDPMHFVLPQLKISINDIIMSFICKIVKSILDTIRRPDCTDLLAYGAVGFGEAMDFYRARKRARDANATLDAVGKANETLNAMGAVGPELGTDTGNLLEAVSAVLTPSELCSLLEGSASSDVLQIVFKLVQTTGTTLKEYLKTIEDIEKFFFTLGTVIDPEICAAIRELSDIVISQELCKDDADLRSMLQTAGATEEQITSELEALNQKRKILAELSKKGDFSGLLPGMTPAQLAEAGVPGPYNNSFASKMVKYGASSIFTNLKTYYSLEAAAFPSKFIDEIIEMVQPGDPGFNSFDYARYIFYKKHSDELAENLEQSAEYLPPKLGKVLFRTEGSLVSYDGQLKQSRDVYTEEYKIEEIYLPFVHLLPLPSESTVEDLSEFAELVERHVVGYMEKYSTIKQVVTQTLKHILESDVSTMVRKFPSFKNSLREFHVRLATERTEVEPFDLSGLSKASVGTSLGLTDLSFYDGQIKDCYRFSYDIAGTRDIITKIYNETIPAEYVDFRSEGLDILSTKHRDKLLRPGGFATLLTQKYKELANNNPGPNTFSVYSESDSNNIVPKLLGYIDSPDMGAARAAFDSVLDQEEGNSLGELLLALLVGALAAAGEISETSNGQPLYSSVVDSFNYQLSDLTKNSRYFNVDAMLELEDSLSTEYNIENNCYVKNNSTLNFQVMVDRFAEKFNQKISEAKHDPTKRDFNALGPYEESAIESLFKVYVDFYCLEMMFKNIFLLSEVGAKRIFKSEFVIDYIVDSIATEMQGSLFNGASITKFNEILKSITNLDDPKESIKTLVVKNLDVEEMSSFIDDIYQPKYSSFKERVYNELIDNVKEVPGSEDYPKVTLLSDFSNLTNSPREVLNQAAFLENYGGFQDIPVSARLPNLYDKFKFEGYSDELIQKKINSGHFWVERFYRIDNFSTFKSKYNQIQRYVSTNPAYNRLQPLTGIHKEYISAEDLEKILFGYQSYEDLERYNQTIEDNLSSIEVEYKYIKCVFLAFLSNFYRNGSYKSESLASKVMIDIGMAQMSDEDLSRKIRVIRTQDANALHVVETTPFDDEQIEIDLAYRTGAIRVEELYKRMESRFEIGKAVASGQVDGSTPIAKSWETIPDENKHDVEFGLLAKHYDWVNFFDVPSVSRVDGVENLSVKRKSQIIVDCLTRFVEISQNWVTRRRASGQVLSFTPVWRDHTSTPNSGFTQSKLETLTVISKVGSAFYSGKYPTINHIQYNLAKSLYHASSDAPLNEQWTDTFYFFVNHDTNDRDSRGSVVYEPGDRYQEILLSLYIGEIFSPTTDISYEESRVGVLNLASTGVNIGNSPLANINIPGLGNLGDAIRNSDSDIFSKQAELYNHLKNNLKVGYRLMFGHKVKREEVNFKGEGINRINPEDIYKDFKLRDGTTGMGLADNAGLFTTKKSFLGHADVEPLSLGVPGEGTTLNSRSAFYSNAMKIVSSRNAGLFSTYLSPEVAQKNQRIEQLLGEIEGLERTIESLRTSGQAPPGFSSESLINSYRNSLESKKSEVEALEDEIKQIISISIPTDNEVDLITPEIENVLVYSIPMDEYVMDVDCFEEIFSEFEKQEKTKLERKITESEQKIEELQDQNEDFAQDAVDEIIESNEERLSELNQELSALLSTHQRLSASSTDFGRPARVHRISLLRKEISDLLFSLEIARTSPEAFYDQQTTDRMQELISQNNTWKDDIDFEGFFKRGENRVSTTGKIIRRNFIRKHIFEKYNDKMSSELLSVSRQEDGKWSIDQDADPLKVHKMLFDFLFPLDRYAPLHFLQNLEVFQNEKGDVNILKATKLFVLQHMLLMHGIGNTTEKPEDSVVDDSHALLSQNIGSGEITATEIMEMIWEAIINAAKDATAAAIREIVRAVDPGYRDMRRGYLKDPCSMKSGLKSSLVAGGSVRNYSGGRLERGFGKSNGCNHFVPVNNFPLDLLEGSLELDFRRVRDASINFAGLLHNKKRRYGLPMTILSGLAMGVREVKGEKYSRLKRKNNCEDDCATKPIVTPKGKCEDK